MKVLHISIPKNGGTYIANNLARHFEPSKRYIVDENTVKLADFQSNADEITTDYDFVAGHIPFRFVSEFAQKFDLIISSFRHPWTRCWSTYRYVTTHQVAWSHLEAFTNEEVPAKFETFIDEFFLANRFTRNNQCGYLGSANLPQSAMSNIDSFGIKMVPFDCLSRRLQTLMQNHGMRFSENTRRNSSESGIKLRLGDCPQVDVKINEWFSGDFQLYEALTRRLGSL